jgi:4'-phosphopantetheinyl transferase
MKTTERTPLLDKSVHIWRFPLIAARQEITAITHWLSPRELAALDRIILPTQRDKRIVAWGRLRYVLSRYLACLPGNIGLERQSSDRPKIVCPANTSLRFSLSHSGSLGLVAVTADAVGVDIEQVQSTTDVERLSRRFFTLAEAEDLQNLSEADRIPRFFRLWVLKEAYLKALGEGVPAGLSKCDIALDADGPRIRRSAFESPERQHALIEIPVSKGYVAALAVARQDADVTVLDL